MKIFETLAEFQSEARRLWAEPGLASRVDVWASDPAGYPVTFEPYVNLSLPPEEVFERTRALQAMEKPAWKVRSREIDDLAARLQLLLKGGRALLEIHMLKGLFGFPLWSLSCARLGDCGTSTDLAELLAGAEKRIPG